MAGRAAVGLVFLAAAAGCSATRVLDDHPLLVERDPGAAARVYFLRPRPAYPLGVADNRITVEADRRPLLAIAAGEYTLVHLVPGAVWITTSSAATRGPEHRITELSKTDQFEFARGRTYYIVLTPVDGEFRGAYYRPESVDPAAARDLARTLRAVGGARGAPIGGS